MTHLIPRSVALSAKRFCLIASFVLLGYGVCDGDIVVYDFTGLSFSATSVDPLATATDITPVNQSTFNVNDTLGFMTQPVLQASTASTTPADAVANDQYFSFEVTPNSGATLDLTSLVFQGARGGGGTPRGWEVRSSVDSFASTLGQADIPTVRPTLTGFSVDLSAPAFDSLSGPVEFRVYTYSPNINNSVEYDDFRLVGTISAATVPEPTGGLLLALGALAITMRRRS